jgi:hypothetical protein
MHKLRELAWPLGQPLSRSRNFLRQSWLFHRFRSRRCCDCPSLRSGVSPKRYSSSSYRNMLPVRPLRSTVVTRFLATTSLSDSRLGPFPRLLIPLGRWGSHRLPALPGLPGSSADLSLRAVPNHPGRSGECLLIASPPVSGFILFGRLATST